MLQSEIDEYLLTARSLVEEAGNIALRYFRMPLHITNKETDDGFDPVTVADREVEAYIRRQLQKLTPNICIVGEEEGFSASEAGVGNCRWVIDPIDGTRSFISGFPTWGILLGLVLDERAVAGIAHQPFTRETFVSNGNSSVLIRSNTERPLLLGTSKTTQLSEALMYCTDSAMFHRTKDRAHFDRVAKEVTLCRFGGDCYSYCMLAAGHIDLVIEGGLQPYDIVALIPIVEAAGGVITNWRGESAVNGGLVVAASTPELHAEALTMLNTDPLVRCTGSA